MPWDIKRDSRCPKSKPHGVVKRADGELEGCHATAAAAKRQLAALNAAELNRQVKMSEEATTKDGETEEVEEKGTILGLGVPDGTGPYGATAKRFLTEADLGHVPYGVTSFADLDAAEEAAETALGVRQRAGQFQRLVDNIMMDPEIGDKGAAVGSLASEFSRLVQDTMQAKEVGNGCPDCMPADEFILPDEGDVLTEALAEELKELSGDDLHYKFTGSPRNKFGTHSSYGFKGGYASAWRIHFSKVGGGALTGAAGGPLRGTVRRTEMIGAGMKPPCKLPSTESIGARGGAKSPLPGSFPEKPGDYGLSSWAKPENEKDREGMKLSCDDLATIKRAALGEIKWRQRQRESKDRGLLEKVVDAVKSVFDTDYFLIPKEYNPRASLAIQQSDDQERSNFFIWKEGDRYRWFTFFSNNFRDKDNPPEILVEAAHKEFIEAVDAREWPYPELLHWHTPGTRWGVADWLSYADGFALASGWVDRGHEKEAEAVAAMSDVRVSHGMPVSEIRRDKDDPTVITRYRSIEISDLPGWAAANPLTGFNIIGKEVSQMPIPEEKRKYLREAGVSEEQLAQAEAAMQGMAKEAGDAGLEHKETDAAPETEVQPEPATADAGQPQALTREEVAEGIAAAIKPLQDAILALADEVKAVKETDEAKIAKAVAGTPAASLADLVRQRAVGAPEAKVDGRSALAKGPKVPDEAKQKAMEVCSVPWINQMLGVGVEEVQQ